MDEHQLWRPLWQRIGDLIRPTRATFTTQRSPGSKQTDQIFDSTAISSCERFAATLSSALTNAASPWFALTIRNEQLAEDHDVMEWLEESSRRMHRAYNESNFYPEVQEDYLDQAAFGTGALFIDELNASSPVFSGLNFRTLPLSNIGIDEDADGKVNTVYRTFTMSCAAAVGKWGENSGEKVLKAFEDGKYTQTFEFLHAVFPREVGGMSYPMLGTPNTKMPIACVYVSVADKAVIEESGYQEMPIVVARLSKTPGEKYGRGLGHMALPDVATLNKEKEIMLKTAAKNLDMPLKVRDDGVKGPIRDGAGGTTVVRGDMDAIQPLYQAGSFKDAIGTARLVEADLIQSTRGLFYADLTELPEGPIMTATEVVKRLELLQRKLGPIAVRQKSELLKPLIDRTFGIMYRRGALPPPPQVLLEQGADIDISYIGPLENAQRLGAVEGLERMQNWILQTAQLDPSVLDNFDFDAASEVMSEVLNVPAKVMRSADQVAEIRKNKAQQQAQQQQKADISQLAEAAGKAAPMAKVMQGAPA